MVNDLLPRFPFRVEFEVTSVCNLDCTYCYAKPFSNQIIPLNEVKYLLKKTKDEANPFEMIIMGGEPFIREDIIEILDFASNLFKVIGISTNGTLINRLPKNELKLLKYISKGSPILQISMDSLLPEINDKIRGKLEDVIKGLEILEDNGIPFGIGITLTEVNINDVDRSVNRLIGEYKNLKTINLENLQPTYSLGIEDFKSLKPTTEEMINVYKSVHRSIRNASRSDVSLYGIFDECSSRNTLIPKNINMKTCLAGLIRAGIFVNGDVTPCLIIRDRILGNLYKKTWAEIWDKSVQEYKNIKDGGGQCYSCNLSDKKEQRNSKKIHLKILNN